MIRYNRVGNSSIGNFKNQKITALFVHSIVKSVIVNLDSYTWVLLCIKTKSFSYHTWSIAFMDSFTECVTDFSRTQKTNSLATDFGWTIQEDHENHKQNGSKCNLHF